MGRRLSWPLLAGTLLTLCACEAPREVAPVPATPAPTTPARAPLTPEELQQFAAECERAAKERFQKERPAGDAAASYRAHYNPRMRSCFYLVSMSGGAVRRMLYDLGEGELYGEYLGQEEADTPQSALATVCRVESMHCASEREWNVLVTHYMGGD